MSEIDHPREDRARELANNGWVVLASRLSSALAVPAIIGGFAFVISVNSTLAVYGDDIDENTESIGQLERRMSATEATRFTNADASVMQAGLQRELDNIIAELRLLRQELRDERARNPQ